MEKAIIVTLDVAKSIRKKEEASAVALEELNGHLAEGWSVKHAYSMGGTDSYVSASLVILEKEITE